MGLCASKTALWGTDQQRDDEFKTYRTAVEGESGSPQPSAAKEQLMDATKQSPASCEAEATQLNADSNVNAVAQSPGPASTAMMILEVKSLLQDIAAIPTGSLCAAGMDAAEAIFKHLEGVAHVGIICYTSSPGVLITPGLAGEAVALLAMRRIILNATWAAALASSSSSSSSSNPAHCSFDISGGSSNNRKGSNDSSGDSGRIYFSVGAVQPTPPLQQQQCTLGKLDQQQDQQQQQQQQQQQHLWPAGLQEQQQPHQQQQDHQQQQPQVQAEHYPPSSNHAQQDQQQQPQTAAVGRPDHWELPQSAAGMQTLLAMPIRDAAGNMLGLLELGSKQQDAFMDCWWDPVISIICSSLVPLLSCPIANGIRTLMGHLIEARHDFTTFVTTGLQGVAALFEMVTNLHLGVRLGLLSPDGQEVLLMHVDEPPPPTSTCDEDGEPTGEFVSSSCCMPGAHTSGRLLAECIDTQQTLLAAAVEARHPKVLQDTATGYLEDNGITASDIFVGPSSHDTPNSIMVMPLMHPSGSPAFGGLYVTQSKRGDFSCSQAAIECVATGLQALFVQQLVTPPADWSILLQQPPPDVTPSSSVSRRPSNGVKRDDSAIADSSTLCRRNSSNLSHSNYLGTMVKAIQTDVQEYLDAKKQFEADIQLLRVLGRGGFGTVFEGRWQGCRAAIKVMYVPENLRRLMKCALEMATMATISHPNIVRVYTCLTDMVEETGLAIPGQMSSPRCTHFRPALPDDHIIPEDEQQQPAICNVMVMELCDLGNLRRALEKGLLHKPVVESRRIVVDMELLLEVLLDTAHSIQHIHSLNMLHCDIKAENVLLKTSSSSSKQFVCKLADFGLMKVMHADKMYLRNMSISGTITHVAPERLEGDSQLTTAVDSYGFGMLMWEVYTSQAPFATLRPAEIVRKVYHGERPAFPTNTPAPYQQLAEACWSHDPALRPGMDVIVQQLQIWQAHLAANPPST